MQVDYAFVAEAATTQTDGKVNALGIGLEDIGAQSFPLTHPGLTLVVRLHVHTTECDRDHVLEIQLWGADHPLDTPRLSASFNPQRHPGAPARGAYLQLALGMRDILFPEQGDYAFHIIVDGTHLRQVPLYLHSFEEMQQLMGSSQPPI